MEKNASILVVDDDKEIADLVEIYLVNDGYQVLKASDGEQCLQTLKEHPEVRMLILDIMMPGIDGLEVCREIRKTSNIPILILSAKAEDMDKIVGFGTGADDYLTKPFHPLELLARVKSQMKRYTTIQLGEEQQPASKDEIEIQDLTINKAAHVVKKNGKENNVLKNFNVNIEAGKNVAFVGSSGGGKSTIFKLICGLYEVNGGTVEIFGKRIGEENIDLIRKDIALVSQDTYLFPETIAWNVACGDESVSMERIIECCKKARIHDDIMKMPQGYNTDAGERGNMLSGGQKQRIAIARALLKDARLILFDEPTASVDIENEEKIKQAIEEIKENHTIITIAHRLNTIENADCIYVVDNGVIAESGTHDELIAGNGIYKRLYDTKDEVSYE